MPMIIVVPAVTPDALSEAMANHDGSNLHHLKVAVEYMVHHGIEEMSALGNIVAQRVVVPKRGDFIRIPKGTSITNPTTGDSSKAGKSYRGKVFQISRGHLVQEYTDSPKWIEETPICLLIPGSGGVLNRIYLRDWFECGGRILAD